jgi:hypothetical protein
MFAPHSISRSQAETPDTKGTDCPEPLLHCNQEIFALSVVMRRGPAHILSCDINA